MLDVRGLFSGLVFFFGLIGTVDAADPADNIIKGAIGDVARFEQQAQGLTPSRKANIRRILKLMNLTRERLDSSPNKDHESWKDADQRFSALQDRLEGLLDGSASPAQQTPPPVSTTATTTQPTEPAATNNVRPLVSGERVRVKKLARDIGNARGSIKTSGPSEFLSAQIVEKYKKSLDKYTEALKRYPQVDDPDVQIARREFDTYRAALSAEYQRAKAQSNARVRLKELIDPIDVLANKNPVPQRLETPFSEADAKAWAAATDSARKAAEHSIDQLNKMAPLAQEAAVSLDRRLARSLAILEQIATEFNETAEYLELQRSRSDPSFFLDLDPTVWKDRANSFLSEYEPQRSHERLDEMRAIAASEVYFYSSIGKENIEADNRLEEINKARTSYDEKRQIALSGNRLPEPKSTSAEMLALAKEIVENPKYEFGEHGPIILTTDKIVDRERKESEAKIDDVDVSASGDITLKGTETTWTYKWKEFKFATPLKEENGDWYIWWITAKNFSSGGNRTPIGSWISGGANKGMLILEENIRE